MRKGTYSKRKFLLAFAVTMALLAALQHLCAFTVQPFPQPDAEEADTLLATTGEPLPPVPPVGTPMPEEHEGSESDSLNFAADSLRNDSLKMAAEIDSLSLNAVRPMRNYGKVWSYSQCFPDSQALQLEAAMRNGIRPVGSREGIDALVRAHKLADMSHSPFYVVDSLTHSTPYLVPKAQQLLNTIAVNFIDSLVSKGMPPHAIFVTSVLRTVDDVSNLKRRNRNATENSCHCYGTTIDISYNKFIPITGQSTAYAHPSLWDDDMKFALAEVLADLRAAGKCYVKYERWQACFHLTVR